MGYLFKSYPKTYNAGDPSAVWSAKVNLAIKQTAHDLADAGWSIEWKPPWTQAVTTTDITSFATQFAVDQVFYAVYPPGYVSGDRALIVVDVWPGYPLMPGFELFAVTGSVDKAIIHLAVVDAMAALTTGMSSIGTDLSNPLPNTYLQIDQGPDVQPIVPAFAGVGLNTTISVAGRGGYACQCAPNLIEQADPDAPPIGEDNFTSLYISRNEVAGIDPNPPRICFAKEFGPQPIEVNQVVDVDRTDFQILQITKADRVMAAGPHHCAFAQVSDGFSGHMEVAALDLPVEIAAIVEATMAVGAGDAFFGGRFREHPNCSGMMRLAINGQESYLTNSGHHSPRVMTLWGSAGGGHPWENGLGQISEPWCGFNLTTGNPAAILGKFPGAIVIFKGYDAVTTAQFIFDNKPYRIFGNNVSQGSNGNLGTLAFRSG